MDIWGYSRRGKKKSKKSLRSIGQCLNLSTVGGRLTVKAECQGRGESPNWRGLPKSALVESWANGLSVKVSDP
jgi:hypothetical protein